MGVLSSGSLGFYGFRFAGLWFRGSWGTRLIGFGVRACAFGALVLPRLGFYGDSRSKSSSRDRAFCATSWCSIVELSHQPRREETLHYTPNPEP